jgi:hypothetical protein
VEGLEKDIQMIKTQSQNNEIRRITQVRWKNVWREVWSEVLHEVKWKVLHKVRRKLFK